MARYLIGVRLSFDRGDVGEIAASACEMGEISASMVGIRQSRA